MTQRRPVLVFDLTSGADPERHPVVRFRIVAFTGGVPPEFLPAWEEEGRLDLHITWGYEKAPYDGAEGLVYLGPDGAAGTIDGWLHRHAFSNRRKRHVNLAWHSPGELKRLVELYKLVSKPWHWRAKKLGLPAGIVEAVKL